MSDLTSVRCPRSLPVCDGSGFITTSGYCNICGNPPPGPPSPPPKESIPSDQSDQSERPERSDRSDPLTDPPGAWGTEPPWHGPGGLIDLPQLSELPGLNLSGPPAVMAEGELTAALRRCGNCGSEVARAVGAVPAALEGKCACGQRYSFTVKLAPGDRLGEQGRYEIIGRLAHGGQGWVYAALDHHLSHGETRFWVALKGLLDTENPAALAAAAAERRFLTSVSHPNIVKIRDFVVHDRADYIVMDYVRGMSLARLAKTNPLTPATAVRYVLRLLPALGHLHRLGLIYCDLKPDNVMAVPGDIVLIDLGGARRRDDQTSGFASTAGYRAPELEDRRGPARYPSVASDLFAAARTLAVLVLGSAWDPREYRSSPPDPDRFEVLRRFDSLYRLLAKGMAREPADRFASAEEMRDQLEGILRELHVRAEGAPPGMPRSPWFEAAPHHSPTGHDGLAWTDLPLPRPQVNPDDPVAPALVGLPARDDPRRIVELLAKIEPMTVEVMLARARAALEAGDPAGAGRLLDEIEQGRPPDWRDWRVQWFRGLVALATGDAGAAVSAFDHVCSQVPGELAPRLALAAAAERAGDLRRAATLYDVVSSLDVSAAAAAFGLARCGPPSGRIAAYERVPVFSRAYVESRIRIIALLIEPEPGAVPTPEMLAEAGDVLRELERELAEEQRERLRFDLLSAGTRLVAAGGAAAGATVLDHPLRARDLAFARSESLRRLARLAKTRHERVRRVTEANRLRPWTWW
jgi:serine/threonine-protein kinase PknG